MKKIFAIAAMAAMLIACGDEKPENKPQGGGNNNGGTEQPEPEFVPAITLDGNFADWAAVEAEELSLVEGHTYGTKADLKKVKFASDEMYIYVYAEYDPIKAMALCVYLDIDADETTGRGEPCQGIELYLDGTIAEWSLDETGENYIEPRVGAVAADCATYTYTGADGASEWAWDTSTLAAGLGFANTCTPVKVGELEAFEMAILKELCPFELGEQLGIAVSLTAYNWDECGTLPQYSTEEVAADETLVGRAACHILNL